MTPPAQQADEKRNERPSPPVAHLDRLLTAQFAIAWAGEGGTPEGVQRLGWWKTDLISVDGGRDLFSRLLPNTFEWATFQAARDAAIQHDARTRAKAHDPDQILSLYSLGFEHDEQAEDRLRDLKQAGEPPLVALPGLALLLAADWDRNAFLAWIADHGAPDFTGAPIGRRLKGAPPADLAETVGRLVAAFAPLADAYPLPHFRHAP